MEFSTLWKLIKQSYWYDSNILIELLMMIFIIQFIVVVEKEAQQKLQFSFDVMDVYGMSL